MYTKHCVAGVLAALLAWPATSRAFPVAFAEDWESYPVGTPLRLTGVWGYGTGPEPSTQIDPGGDKAICLKGNYASGATFSTTQLASFAGSMAGGAYPQVMTFTLQSQLDQQNPVGNHFTIQLNESSGGELARWYGYSSAVTPRWNGVTGRSVDIRDGAPHEFTIIYDALTGNTEWLHNGTLQWTYTLRTGMIAERVWVQDVSRGANDYVWFDDLVVGYVPEPASMAMLALGALFIRRRRA